MNRDERDPEDGEDYAVRPAPAGATSQGGTGDMVVLPGRRPATSGTEGTTGTPADEDG